MRELCDSLVAGILKICETNNTKVARVESLTGGLLADAFVRIPGVFNVLLGSAVTYDINAEALILYVDKAPLDREGTVYPGVARQMAVSIACLYSQLEYDDRIIGLSTTGVAGPGPGGDKPAEPVHVGLRISTSLTPDHAEVLKIVELHLDGMREEIRRLTVLHVLQNLNLFTASFKE